ncbi:MAG: hypothetical protein HPY57_13890 [Ignavibacteria bacterium]|nr:hypothetical protein [Ignavibacteria bacterium]
MIERNKHINQLWYIKHRNDQLKHTGFDYENNLLKKLLSSQMFGNPNTAQFLSYLQGLLVWQIEATLVVRNFWNYTVDKYYNKHNN